MTNIFELLYNYFKNQKIKLFGFLFLLIISLLFFSLKLNFEEDISKLIPQSEKTKTLNNVLNNVDFSDKIIVNIAVKENGNPTDLTKYATQLIDSLNVHCKEYILNIQGEISNDDMMKTMDFIYNNLPLFLNKEDYKNIATKIKLSNVKEVVNGNYKTLVSPSGMIAKKTIRKDPFGLSFIALKKLEDLKIDSDFDIFNGFIITADKKNILLFIKPKLPANETDANSDFVTKLYKIADDLNLEFKDKATCEYYGSTVIAVANANQIKTDINFTVGIAMTVLMLILILFYKKISIPLILFLPTIIGALLAIVSLYFIREKVSAISLGIGSVLLGITLDYSLHILTHYRNSNNVKQLYKDVTKPILMSSITTAIAFLCLLFLKSQALQDLGIFAAISVLGASIFALVLIPLLYKPKQKDTTDSKNILEKIASYKYDKSKILIYVFLALFVGSFFTYKNVSFNKDLSKMNFLSEANLKAEQNLESILKLSSKSVYLVSYADDMSTVLNTNTAINKALKQAKLNKTVIQFSSIGSMVLSKEDQLEKIKDWNFFWKDSIKAELKKELIIQGKKIGFSKTTYTSFYNLINKEFQPISLTDYKKVKAFLVPEYISNKKLKTAVSIVKINENQKEKLQQIIDGIPNSLLIDRKEINETFLGGLKDNFSTLINYSFLAVIIILFLFYRNLELTVLTISPIVITWLLTLGVMGFFNIEFTIFNVIISTFIFGLGVDYSIFITNALVKDYTYGTKEINTYKVSILLSVITTILGIGVLVFAKHPALRSISVLSLVGILLTLFVSFIMQPILFRFFVSNRAKKGLKPIKIRTFIHSVFLMTFYSLGGMLLSLLSLIILPIIPLKKKIKFAFLHKSVAWLVQIVLYGNPFVKKKVINTIGETFEKPSIIIANHASSLDTLTMGLITHKVIYLVNDWVYKSPVFGILARVMGFYPVSNGVDDSVEHLKEKINQGYSLMVFPEGKRSLTNKIGRFHKGAFFLQEHLKIDILPIYFHGNSEVMPKNDVVIHDGSLTVKVGKRIKFDDASFGETSKERSKKISAFYKNEFLKLRSKIENEDYFKDILLSNYTYKDKSILTEISKDFENKKTEYHQLNELIPTKTTILHLANDFGQIDVLLKSKSFDRKIASLYSDNKKKTIAQNCYTTNFRKVTYINDIKEVNNQKFDVLIISDIAICNSIELTNFETIYIFNDIDLTKYNLSNFKAVFNKKTLVVYEKK